MRWARRTALLALLLGLVAFPYGPLFPWSPVTPGYERLRLQRADVLFPHGTTLNPAFRELDRYIAEAEEFHGLKMPKRVTVVSCRDWEDFQRFMPNMRSRGLGAVTLSTGTVVYVTPKLRERNLDTGEFLRHELSHAALHQNQNLVTAVRTVNQQWFAEGLAVMFGKQQAYVTASEFMAGALTDDLWPYFDGSEQKNMRFAYQAWRYFLEYLIATRGRDRFLELERRCMVDPEQCRAALATTYNIEFQQAIKQFQSDLRQGRWSAVPLPEAPIPQADKH